MKIEKKLKFAEFEWDDETKMFTFVTVENPGTDRESRKKIRINKIYAFAFQRFIIRMAQRAWFRRKKSS